MFEPAKLNLFFSEKDSTSFIYAPESKDLKKGVASKWFQHSHFLKSRLASGMVLQVRNRDRIDVTVKPLELFEEINSVYKWDESDYEYYLYLYNVYSRRFSLVFGLAMTYFMPEAKYESSLYKDSLFTINNQEIRKALGPELDELLNTTFDSPIQFHRILYEIWFNFPEPFTDIDKEIKMITLEFYPEICKDPSHFPFDKKYK